MENKIIIFNAGGYGDILNTTPIAKHYKLKNSNCKITWITREKYISALKNNKYIDKIVLCDESKGKNNLELTYYYMNLFKEKQIDVKFVAPYVSSILKNEKNLPLARSTLLNIIFYETSGIKEWECDFIPNVSLSHEEKQEANLFFNKLPNNKKILLEYEIFSNQSPFNHEYFNLLCDIINNKKIDIIFTGLNKPNYFNDSYTEKYKINFYHYTGSFMSNAELYNLSDFFISTCSGITCLTHADYCDTEKIRIEVSHGYHWSSIDWKHMKNKNLCFHYKQYEDTLSKYFKG